MGLRDPRVDDTPPRGFYTLYASHDSGIESIGISYIYILRADKQIERQKAKTRVRHDGTNVTSSWW
jgi:hypothetical protein